MFIPCLIFYSSIITLIHNYSRYVLHCLDSTHLQDPIILRHSVTRESPGHTIWWWKIQTSWGYLHSLWRDLNFQLLLAFPFLVLRSSDVNQSRLQVLQNKIPALIPPCRSVLNQKIRRTRFGTHMWQNANKQQLPAWDPCQHGWTVDNGVLCQCGSPATECQLNSSIKTIPTMTKTWRSTL